MKRDFKRGNFKKDFRSNNRFKGTDAASTEFSKPNRESVSSNSELLQVKAFRDLQNIRSIDVKADPYSQMSYGSFPYTIIGSTNRVEDASYPGQENIAGNSVVQIQNNTSTSSLMTVFDTAISVKTRNYLYLPIRSNGQNLAYLTEVCKSVEQAIAFGQSTMLTQLKFTQSAYVSDMPKPTPYADASSTTVNAWSYTVAMIHYQTVLQNVVRPISKYVQLRSIEKEAMRMSFRTEAPLITQFFGLMKKKSLVACFNTLSTVIINEYFDSNWYEQSTMVDCYYSRKTKGMSNPLISLVTVDAIPSLDIYYGVDSETGDPILEYSSDDKLRIPTFEEVPIKDDKGEISDYYVPNTYKLLDPETFSFVIAGERDESVTEHPYKYKGWSLEHLILNLCKLLDIHYVLTWARQHRVNPTSAAGLLSVSAYAQAIADYLNYIIDIDTAFSSSMSDVRTFLDRLSASNLVYWKKGVSFWISDNIQQIEPTYNVLVSNIFAANLSSGYEMTYDTHTRRWKMWTLWNKFEGIPNYDLMSGGAFLTFGLRKLDTTGASMESSEGLIPILYVYDDPVLEDMTNICYATSRSGYQIALTAEHYTSATVLANPYLNRLDPLKSNVSIKMPSFNYTSGALTTSEKTTLFSYALQFMSTVFGYGIISDKTNANTYTILDPDYVCFLDDEIYDVSNEMIKFARNYAPFRVSTPDGSRTMGFLRSSHSSVTK